MGGPWELYADQAPAESGPWTIFANQKFTPPSQDELAKLDSDQKVDDYLKGVPDDQREDARKAWADAYVANARKDGGTGQRVLDTVARVADSVPGLGAYTDEADAGLRSLAGENYDNSLAVARARHRAIENTPTAKIASTPFGDIYESGLEKAAGAIGGGLALPTARVMGGSGALPAAVNTGATAGGYAAAQGFGEGEGEGDRLQKAQDAGLMGAAIGAPLGGIVGGYLSRVSPATAAAAANTPRGRAIQAAERLRANVGDQDLPQFLATDSPTLKSFSGALNSMPGSAPLRNSAEKTIEDLGSNVGRIADQYGAQGTGATLGATDAAAATDAAGTWAGNAIRNWIGPTSRAQSSANYNAAWNALPAGATADLTNTRQALQAAMDRAHAAGSDVGNDVFNLIGDAATRPGGLTIDGLKQLKSDIQARQNNQLLPEYTKLKDYLKPISSALDSDLRAGIQANGGTPALNAYDNAAVQHRGIAINRANLAKIVGNEQADAANAASPQAVIDRLTRMAGEGGSANIQRLLRARNAITASSTPCAWNDVAAAVIRRAGEVPGANVGMPGQTAAFSPDRFLTFWNKGISEAGKDALFGARGQGLRQSLDDIATISDRFRGLRQFQNSSGTAHSAAWFELGLFALDAHWLEPITQLAGTNAIARLLSRPASARTVSRFGNAITNFAAGNGGRPAVRLATLNLAREIADQTGEDEKDVSAKFAQALPASRATQ